MNVKEKLKAMLMSMISKDGVPDEEHAKTMGDIIAHKTRELEKENSFHYEDKK